MPRDQVVLRSVVNKHHEYKFEETEIQFAQVSTRSNMPHSVGSKLVSAKSSAEILLDMTKMRSAPWASENRK